MSKPNIGQGNINLQLDGENVVLRPSLDACMQLSGMPGGITEQMKKVQSLEFGAIQNVIVAGLGFKGKGSKDLPEKIYKTGLLELQVPCLEFLSVIANGGRKIGDSEEESQSDPLA